jgi:protein-L-isoaspartate(D-aspartate) O-methyltransferase
MVEEQIIERGISDLRVIEAMRHVPRHEFVLPQDVNSAYVDSPVSIGEGQTISQPYMVALMTQTLQLKAKDRILEIGTGSGYQTAILAELCAEVYTIEKIKNLAERAEDTLQRLNYHNIKFKIGDGTQGWGEGVLFDAIMVTAASPAPLEHLLDELRQEGRMAIPIGDKHSQTLTLLTKSEHQIETKGICQCVFVPLLGEYGWR